jgi:hypothetical protein
MPAASPFIRDTLNPRVIRTGIKVPSPIFIDSVAPVNTGPLPMQTGELFRADWNGTDVGDTDARHILSVIDTLAKQYSVDPRIRADAVKIARPAMNNDVRGMFRNIVEFVETRVLYVADPADQEWIIAPNVMLDEIAAAGRGHGDCDDHVVLGNTLLLAVGIPARPVAVKVGGSEFYNHVISEVNVDGNRYTVDWINKDGQSVRYTDYLVLK